MKIKIREIELNVRTRRLELPRDIIPTRPST